MERAIVRNAVRRVLRPRLGLHVVAAFVALSPIVAHADVPAQIATVTVASANNLHITLAPGQTTKVWERSVGQTSHPGFLGGDFTGDGASDVACIDFDGSDDPYLFLTAAPGRSTTSTTAWQNALRSSDQLTFYFIPGDFDGDSRSDVMAFYVERNGNNVDVSSKITFGPTGASSTAPAQDWVFTGQRESAFIAGKFRGTGPSNDSAYDVAALSHDGSGGFTAKLYVGPTGTYASGADWAIPGVSGAEPVAFRGADFNGDGYADIAAVFYESGTQQYSAKVALGPSGATVRTWALGNQQFVSVLADDFNGDGYADIAGIRESGTSRSATVVLGTMSGSAGQTAMWTLTSTPSTTGQYLAGTFSVSSISGQITYENGTPFQNASVDAGAVGSDTTDSNGRYSIDGFVDGMTYSIVPSTAVTGPLGLGYRFSPVNRSGTITNDLSLDFVALENRDTDNDGVLDHLDSDDDNDGLSDLLEAEYGTDPLVADTDGDGVSDGQEVTDGSDPLDRGSNARPLDTELCSDWNGFLNMWNIQEHANVSNHSLDIVTTLYDQSGAAQGSVSFTLPAGRHLDVLVHEIPGWQPNAYGRVCSRVMNGAPGDLDGRMVYYKQNTQYTNPLNERFDFAFALNFSNGLTGRQYVGFNTFQPSLNPAERNLLSANWIQLTNLTQSQQSGTMLFYGQDGVVLSSKNFVLAGNARLDVGAHDIGRSIVGTVAWVPDDPLAEFGLRNARYFHGSANLAQLDFMSAAVFDGETGIGRETIVPLDAQGASAILEISNVASLDVVTRVQIYTKAGQLAHGEDFIIPGHGTRHIIADTYLNGGEGIATVQGGEPESLITTSMHYGRNSSGSVTYYYGVKAVEALGSVLNGSYNTYISQGCRLLLMNQTTSETSATISVLDGETLSTLLAGEVVTVPARGMTDYDLCARMPSNTYGSVVVQPATPSSLAAVIVRRGNQDDYRFPTFLR